MLAAVSARKNEPIVFGCDIDSYEYEVLHSSARLTGFLCECAILEDSCKNQAFNSHDGNPLPWDRFFEELARWYDVEKGVQGPELDDGKFQVTQLKGGKEAPLGYGPPVSIRRSYTLVEWGKDLVNEKVWKEIIDESEGNLKVNAFELGEDALKGD